MAKTTVTINGKEYPIKMTMGAMLRFKKETGKEINDAALGLTDNATLIWCCIKSACAHDKVKFDISLMDFADSIDVNDIEPVVQALFQSAQGGKKEEDETTDSEEGDGEGN